MMGIRNDVGAPVTTQVGAYNVYMGARYVPLIKGKWDSTKNYEPLSIVINQGNSYTSAQYVPAGVPLQDDGPYWFKTGDFSGQVAHLEQTVNQNSQDIISLNDKVGDLTKVNQYWVLLADSYGDTSLQTGINGWTYGINKYFPEGNYEVHQHGGSGFLIGKTFWELAQEVPESNRKLVTDLLVETAFNDYQSTTDQIAYGMRTFIANCKGIFPNIQRFYVIPLFMKNSFISRKYDYFNYLKAGLFGNWKFPTFVQGWVHYYPFLSSDGLHLTQYGYTQLGELIGSFIVGNDTAGMFNLCSLRAASGQPEFMFNTWVVDNDIAWYMSSFVDITTVSSSITIYTLSEGSTTCLLPNTDGYYVGNVGMYDSNFLFKGFVNLYLRGMNLQIDLPATSLVTANSRVYLNGSGRSSFITD